MDAHWPTGSHKRISNPFFLDAAQHSASKRKLAIPSRRFFIYRGTLVLPPSLREYGCSLFPPFFRGSRGVSVFFAESYTLCVKGWLHVWNRYGKKEIETYRHEVLVESLIKLTQKCFKNKNRIGALKYVQLALQVFYESFKKCKNYFRNGAMIMRKENIRFYPWT